MSNPLESFRWKTALLVKGCRISEKISFPSSLASKKIHLYSHSSEKIKTPIPDDLLLPHNTIVRLRYRTNSPYILELTEKGYQIRNEENDEIVTVHLIKRPLFSDVQVLQMNLSSICSYLGTDLLGITPSNYCFYFQNKKQCRFCEILPTFKDAVEFPKTFKSKDIIENALLTALKNDSQLKYIAITTGNIHSYDSTVDYFCEIGQRLQKSPVFQQAEEVLATLMPPDDFSKIEKLKASGFTKVYFPLEVFEKEHFRVVCPGKDEYGYDRLLKALEKATQVFGKGHVYTNFVYGIQSLNSSLEGASYDPEQENILSHIGVREMLERGIIPAFTLYHHGGYNQIGNIQLDLKNTYDFFHEWGRLVQASNIVPKQQEAVLFSSLSLSNTLFNDGYRLARQGIL